MIFLQELLWGFSIYCLQTLNKAMFMASQCSWAVLELLSAVRSSNILGDSRAQLAVVDQPQVKYFHDLNENCYHGESNEAAPDDQKIKSREIICEGWSENSNANNGCAIQQGSLGMEKIGVSRAGINLKKRPSKLLVPDFVPENLDWGKTTGSSLDNTAFEVAGRDFFLACKKGTRRDRFLEDGYSAMVDILGDPKQAFFAVIDGHGGRAATDFVAENLGKNIVKKLENSEDQLEEAIHKGYCATDQEFLSQGFNGGACAASVFLKEGELQAANAGDCKVVLSRKGVAEALTSDHRLSREDERLRIENSGGFVHLSGNGVGRVQGSLAVSRAIGDQHLKDWVISDPEIKKLQLTSDCQFLILASDGLWDKVSEQEAVDLVVREESIQSSSRKLIEASSLRGGIDDITVMVVQLQSFLPN